LEEGWTLRRAAEAAGCSERTAAKWLRRYREGDRVLSDRSSRPLRSPCRLAGERVAAIERLRRVRMTASEIGEVLDLPLSTVSLWLKRIGLGKRSRLDPLEPPNRYERRHAGELVHVDIKQLGRISIRGAGHRFTGNRKSQYSRQVEGRKRKQTGFEYLHVIIDDHSRLAYAEVLDDLTAATRNPHPARTRRLSVRRRGAWRKRARRRPRPARPRRPRDRRGDQPRSGAGRRRSSACRGKAVKFTASQNARSGDCPIRWSPLSMQISLTCRSLSPR